MVSYAFDIFKEIRIIYLSLSLTYALVTTGIDEFNNHDGSVDIPKSGVKTDEKNRSISEDNANLILKLSES